MATKIHRIRCQKTLPRASLQHSAEGGDYPSTYFTPLTACDALS